ncbi:hypothetical protein GZL_02814 [Streptomyces sp. 769]|nr:hypothetical protein GZL_02814 [Streptomyces sp. 769]
MGAFTDVRAPPEASVGHARGAPATAATATAQHRSPGPIHRTRRHLGDDMDT